MSAVVPQSRQLSALAIIIVHRLHLHRHRHHCRNKIAIPAKYKIIIFLYYLYRCNFAMQNANLEIMCDANTRLACIVSWHHLINKRCIFVITYKPLIGWPDSWYPRGLARGMAKGYSDRVSVYMLCYYVLSQYNYNFNKLVHCHQSRNVAVKQTVG